tara:strand:- start:4 stop:366 length:363 start_codon:yes stop_codon:yes gene_type:complete
MKTTAAILLTTLTVLQASNAGAFVKMPCDYKGICGYKFHGYAPGEICARALEKGVVINMEGDQDTQQFSAHAVWRKKIYILNYSPYIGLAPENSQLDANCKVYDLMHLWDVPVDGYKDVE